MEWIKKNEDSIIFFTRKNKKEIANKKIVKFFEEFGEVISTAELLKEYDMEEVEYVLFLNLVLIFQYIGNGEIDEIIIFVRKVLKIGDELSELEKETKETLNAFIEINKKRKELGNIFELELDDRNKIRKLKELQTKLYRELRYLNRSYHQLIKSLSNVITPPEYLRAMQRNYYNNLTNENSYFIKKKDKKDKSD